jgi:hypothetical protein
MTSPIATTPSTSSDHHHLLLANHQQQQQQQHHVLHMYSPSPSGDLNLQVHQGQLQQQQQYFGGPAQAHLGDVHYLSAASSGQRPVLGGNPGLHDLQILNRGQQQLSPMHSNLVRLQ